MTQKNTRFALWGAVVLLVACATSEPPRLPPSPFVRVISAPPFELEYRGAALGELRDSGGRYCASVYRSAEGIVVESADEDYKDEEAAQNALLARLGRAILLQQGPQRDRVAGTAEKRFLLDFVTPTPNEPRFAIIHASENRLRVVRSNSLPHAIAIEKFLSRASGPDETD